MLSQQVIDFFAKIKSDPALQKRLYATAELSEVAQIAKEEGFDIKASEILRAQARRVSISSPEDLTHYASGERGEKGAQWGRVGKGYLDRAGFWLLELEKWGCKPTKEEPQFVQFLSAVKKDPELKKKLLAAKAYDDVAKLAVEFGYRLSGTELVCYQARQVLTLTDEQAEDVAGGAKDRIA